MVDILIFKNINIMTHLSFQLIFYFILSFHKIQKRTLIGSTVFERKKVSSKNENFQVFLIMILFKKIILYY